MKRVNASPRDNATNPTKRDHVSPHDNATNSMKTDRASPLDNEVVRIVHDAAAAALEHAGLAAVSVRVCERLAWIA